MPSYLVCTTNLFCCKENKDYIREMGTIQQTKFTKPIKDNLYSLFEILRSKNLSATAIINLPLLSSATTDCIIT